MDSPNDEYESWRLVDRLSKMAIRRTYPLCDDGWRLTWAFKGKSEFEDLEDSNLEI
jgi:hypothetical protein